MREMQSRVNFKVTQSNPRPENQNLQTSSISEEFNPGAREPDTTTFSARMTTDRASLVAQWLRIHLPMQGTWVRALVREDPTCRGATKPVSHNY